jgi:hypothetical protein
MILCSFQLSELNLVITTIRSGLSAPFAVNIRLVICIVAFIGDFLLVAYVRRRPRSAWGRIRITLG